MSLKKLTTASYSTKRIPEKANGKIGAPVTHLQNVKCTPLQPTRESIFSQQGRINVPVEEMETYTQVSTHIDSGETVTQLPDIVGGDWIVDGSNEYHVKYVGKEPSTSSTLQFIQIIVEGGK